MLSSCKFPRVPVTVHVHGGLELCEHADTMALGPPTPLSYLDQLPDCCDQPTRVFLGSRKRCDRWRA